MRLNKANFAGLISPGQQSEMKAILAGTWPPLKPLPVFKYETAEYRATIDFDRKHGEWVCRKTSLPSNEVQELRGGLREITLSLPHGEEPTFTEEVTEQQEQELEKDANRRLQAVREWREKYENGARYFELREFLSEGQRTELDDSLRLSLTARQLQFNAKNIANVFDDLSVAGGRFAALIELATRSKASQGTVPKAQEEEAVPEAERPPGNAQSLEICSREFGQALSETEPTNDDAFEQDQEAAESCAKAVDFPALSIKNVFPEQDQPSLPERMPHFASQQFEIETSEMLDEDSASLVENSPERLHQESRHSLQEERHAPVFASFAAKVPAGQSFADRIASSPSRFSALKISAFQVNAFALLFLFAVTSFTVGLTVGRGPLGKRLREAPKSLLAADANPPTLPDQSAQADESTPRIATPPPPVANSNDSAGAKNLDDAKPSEQESKAGTPKEGASGLESTGDSDSAKLRSTDSNLSPTTESRPSVKPEVVKPEVAELEVSPEPRGAMGPVARNVLPPASSKLIRRPKAVRSIRSAPRIHAPYKLASTISSIGSAPHVPRPSTILATVPDRGSQPFRVSFPNKTIAATSSLAMTSQLSVLVSPERELAVAHKSARLEAGELVSFGWPRYSEPRGRYGLAETIRVRATIGPLGQVQEVKFLGGSASLIPATTEAIRQWRYTATLLDKRPVQAQQDITIEFRPTQYSARLSTQHPSHN